MGGVWGAGRGLKKSLNTGGARGDAGGGRGGGEKGNNVHSSHLPFNFLGITEVRAKFDETRTHTRTHTHMATAAPRTHAGRVWARVHAHTSLVRPHTTAESRGESGKKISVSAALSGLVWTFRCLLPLSTCLLAGGGPRVERRGRVCPPCSSSRPVEPC